MARVQEKQIRVRSKNAGPFVLTIDVFCPDAESFADATHALTPARIARAFGCAKNDIRYFALADLRVLKFSLPRPVVQGSPEDRDMHASQWGWIVQEMIQQ